MHHADMYNSMNETPPQYSNYNRGRTTFFIRLLLGCHNSGLFWVEMRRDGGGGGKKKGFLRRCTEREWNGMAVQLRGRVSQESSSSFLPPCLPFPPNLGEAGENRT